MIKVNLSEGIAYDILSILEVKFDKFPKNEDNAMEYLRFDIEIRNQIGEKLHGNVIDSIEYDNLYNINKRLFELVDEVKSDNCLGGIVDQYVFKRFQAKQALQSKFFPQNKLGESKFGYINKENE